MNAASRRLLTQAVPLGMARGGSLHQRHSLAACALGQIQMGAVIMPQRTIFKGIMGGQQETAIAPKGPDAVARPINFDIDLPLCAAIPDRGASSASKVEGGESQIVVVDLEPGQVLRGETGSLLYMTDGVEIETSTGGGFGAGLRRMMTGENFFVSDFKYTKESGAGTVALGTDFPSKIIRVSLADFGGALICQKGAFLAGSHDLTIEMAFTRTFKAGFFGGEGFVLQKLMGSGDAFIKAGGALIRRELAQGETLRVTSGAIVAFSPTIEYDVQMMKGFKNVMFGGEGLFITSLTGPGTVFLQSMPFDRMVDQIARRVPAGGGLGLGVPIAVGGGGGEGQGAGGETPGAGGAEEASSAAAMGTAAAGSEEAFGQEASRVESASSTGGGSKEEVWDSGTGTSGDGGKEEVWKEQQGEGGGEGFEGSEEAQQAGGDMLSEVGSVAKDLWGSFWNND